MILLFILALLGPLGVLSRDRHLIDAPYGTIEYNFTDSASAINTKWVFVHKEGWIYKLRLFRFDVHEGRLQIGYSTFSSLPEQRVFILHRFAIYLYNAKLNENNQGFFLQFVRYKVGLCEGRLRKCGKELDCYLDEWQCNGVKECQSGEDEDNCSYSTDHPMLLLPPDYQTSVSSDFSSVPWKITAPSNFHIFVKLNEIHQPSVNKFLEVYLFDGKVCILSRIGDICHMTKSTIVVRASRFFVYSFSVNAKYHCNLDQFSCKSDQLCISPSRLCDGTWDCPSDGSDELHCGKCGDKYICSNTSNTIRFPSKGCYDASQRCDGTSQCLSNADEQGCSINQCNSGFGTFLCLNKRCIFESKRCDGIDDCGDYADELQCYYVSVRIIFATVTGCLVCGLLLVIAIGWTFRVHMSRHLSYHSPRYVSPLTHLTEQIFAHQQPPPTYQDAMRTSLPYNEVREVFLQQMASIGPQDEPTAGTNMGSDVEGAINLSSVQSSVHWHRCSNSELSSCDDELIDLNGVSLDEDNVLYFDNEDNRSAGEYETDYIDTETNNVDDDSNGVERDDNADEDDDEDEDEEDYNFDLDNINEDGDELLLI